MDSACLALTRTVEAFSKDPGSMEMLCGLGLVDSILRQVAVTEGGGLSGALSSGTFYGLLRLLASCAASSHVVADSLLAGGVADTLRNLLATSPLFAGAGAALSPGNALRSTEQLADLVALAAELLLPIPDAAAAILAGDDGAEAAAAVAAGAGKEAGGSSALASPRTKFFLDHPDVLTKTTADLLPLLLRVRAVQLGSAWGPACRDSLCGASFPDGIVAARPHPHC